MATLTDLKRRALQARGRADTAVAKFGEVALAHHVSVMAEIGQGPLATLGRLPEAEARAFAATLAPNLSRDARALLIDLGFLDSVGTGITPPDAVPAPLAEPANADKAPKTEAQAEPSASQKPASGA